MHHGKFAHAKVTDFNECLADPGPARAEVIMNMVVCRAVGWLMVLLFLGIWCTGCNTVRGLGRDIQRSGEIGQKVLNAAD
jgi:predicted small secreted protein